MVDKYGESKRILSGYKYLKRKLANYKRHEAKLISSVAPKPLRGVDYDLPTVQGGGAETDITELSDKIAQCRLQIMELEAQLDAITGTVDNLDPQYRNILRMIYFDGKTNREICIALHFAHESTVCRKKRQAVEEFAKVYPF